MTLNEAMNIIRSQIKCADYLPEPINSLYICPFCGGRSLTVRADETWKCSACHEAGDVLELYEKHTGIRNLKKAFVDLAMKVGINEPIEGVRGYMEKPPQTTGC